jgi:hypothetical protein
MTNAEIYQTMRILTRVARLIAEELRTKERGEGCEPSFHGNLCRLVEQRFGAPPEPALAPSRHAFAAQLLEWLEREPLTVDTLTALVAEAEASVRRPNAAAQPQTEGRPQVRVKGERETLLMLLTARFDTLPEHLLARIHRADLAQLQRWFDCGITAGTLDAVFADE